MNYILLEAPCLFCGYNSNGYFQNGTHSKDCPWYGIGGLEERAFAFRGVVSALYNKELAQQHLTQAKSKPAEIAESIKAACFPCDGEYIVPRKEWLIEWVRQLLLA